MATAATSGWSLNVKKVVDLIAASSTWQTLGGAADAAEALGYTHEVGIVATTFPRPFAVVSQFPEFMIRRISGGDRSGYRKTGALFLLIEAAVALPIAITRSGSTATVTFALHGFKDGETVVISGATQAQYNKTTAITLVDVNSFTYSVSGSPATPATGSPVAAPDPEDPATTEYRYTNPVGEIRDEILDLSGTNNFADVREFELFEGPTLTDKDVAKQDEEYFSSVWRVALGLG